jgi:PKD repeat protein
MKHFALIVSFLFICLNFSLSQEWIANLPQDKIESGTLRFDEIQDAFYDYWEPFDVQEGYYIQDGERVRAPYYKQFKRWEWYWENRIDPSTGEFPDMTQLDNYFNNLLENRSIAGNWTSMGPGTSPGGYAGLGRLNCISFVPGNNSEYYAGAASGGIWHTTDDGLSWNVLNDTVPVLGVSDIIVVDPATGPDILYIATGDRDGGSLWSLGGQQSHDNNSIGILKSTNGGASWTPTSLSFTASQKVRLNRLLLDPSSSNQIMYAATTQGVYKTTDAWATKSLITTTAFIDMEFKPGDPGTIYGSTKSYSTTSIHVSTDAGVSWTNVATYTGRRTELAVSPNQPSWVYAISANSSGALEGIHKSTNSGASFSTVYNSNNLLGWACDGSGSSGQGFYDLCIAADPNNANIVYIGGINTWKSTDGGLSFNIVNHWTGCSSPSNAQAVHADKHFLAFQGNSSTLFECNDGGLYKTTDGGTNWTHLSSGMEISQIYRLGVGQTAANEVIIGLQDNGTKASLSGVWTDVIGGDGFECIIDYSNQNTQYGALYYGSIYLTTNYWQSKANITGSLPGSGAWCTPYLIDPADHQTLYVGYEDIWKTTNQGTTWNQISNQGSSTDFRNMAISASNPSYIYAATFSNIYRTTTGGSPSQSWTNITSNLPVSNSNITYITVKHDDPDHIWVSLGAYNSDGVYESTNGGSSWTNISGGLPQLPVMCVIQNKQYNTGIELYAATDVGVYVKRDGGNWQPFNDGLPNVVVTELEIYYDSNNPDNSKLYAATFGRSVWKSDLYDPDQTPVADFTANPASGLSPLMVTFTDLSQNTISSWNWDFGDGNTSAVQNPSHTYNNPGTYAVKLVVAGPGGTDSITKPDFIQVNYHPPTADFTADFTSGYIPFTVNFTDLSMDSVDAWRWDFGDGDTSVIQNPQHVYHDQGLYTVSLTATGPGGSDIHIKTDYINVTYTPPTADFTANITSGVNPLTVSFTDLSVDSVDTWSWDFGDGGTSTLQNPEHMYVEAGLYTVSLTVTGPGGTDTHTRTDYININHAPPTADFSGDPTAGIPPLTVSFTDLSTDSVNTWLWNFGDGQTSIVQYPSHVYEDPGSYSVSLTVTGPGGNDNETKSSYILVSDLPPVADFSGNPISGNFPLTVNFTDLSTGAVNYWKWYFGDGSTSFSQHPVYTYQNAGEYTVSLVSAGPGGSDSIAKENFITVMVEIDEFSSDILKVFPNPCHEYLIIKSEMPVRSLRITDLIGNVVIEENIVCSNPCEHKFSVAKLNPGIHFCHITLENDRMVLIKVLKE